MTDVVTIRETQVVVTSETTANVITDNSPVQVITAAEQGPPGIPGGQGPQGEQGVQGEPGADGISVTGAYLDGDNLHIETSDDGDFDVGNVRGPQGDPGEEGSQGEQGPQGEQGDAGTDGASAYEIAVLNGFGGTEAEWLESLRGEQGEQGTQGEPGPADLSPFTTDDLAEGSNLYHTDERAQDAVGAMVNSTLTYTDATPLLSINLANANTWTNLITASASSLGATQDQSKGILVQNTTAAVNGTQQLSPGIAWEGRGYRSNSPAGSQQVKVLVDLLPVQQSSIDATGTLQFKRIINGGAEASFLTITTTGSIQNTPSTSTAGARFSGDRAHGLEVQRLVNSGTMFYVNDGGTTRFYVDNSTNVFGSSNCDLTVSKTTGALGSGGIGSLMYLRHISGNHPTAGAYVGEIQFLDNSSVIDGRIRCRYTYVSGGTRSGALDFFTTSLNTNSLVASLTETGALVIGTTGAADASAILEVQNTSKGSIPAPKMTTAQRDAISSPVEGLIVANTTTNCPSYHDGTAWRNIPLVITATASLNFTNTTAQLSNDLTISLTGAADGDTVLLGVPNSAVSANSCFTAWVSAADTVTVRFNNYSSGAINPANATYRVTVIKKGG